MKTTKLLDDLWRIGRLPPWAWAASLLVHASIVGPLLLVTEEPPRAPEPIHVVLVDPPPPPLGEAVGSAEPTPAPVPVRRKTVSETPRRRSAEAASQAKPLATPATVVAESPPPPASSEPALTRGTAIGDANGIAGAIVGGIGSLPIPVGRAARPPVLVSRVSPDYPSAARFRGIEGDVVLEAVVDGEGHVEAPVEVLRSVPGLDEAAVDAVRRWRFRPATDAAGRPLRVIVEIPIRFVLR